MAFKMPLPLTPAQNTIPAKDVKVGVQIQLSGTHRWVEVTGLRQSARGVSFQYHSPYLGRTACTEQFQMYDDVPVR
jgi:hypothetical protein